MMRAFDLPLIYQRAAPFHPLFFLELHDAILRTAYYRTFVAEIAPDEVGKFTAYAAAAPRRQLAQAVLFHAIVSPEGCIR